MDRLAFTSLAAINNQAEVRAQMTNNLANVSTVGFKQTFEIASKGVQVEGEGLNTRTIFEVETVSLINLSPGVPNNTGRAMDVALQDSTVLGVQANNGEIGYTRRGDLNISPSGLIENSAGHLILGEAGPINVPAGQMVSISPDGTVFGSLPSEPDTPPVELGKLMLRDASEMPLVRRSDGLFQTLDVKFRGADFPSGPESVRLQSGSLEGSNVNPIEVMIKMMDFSRAYEAQIKMINQVKDIAQKGSGLMRLS